MGVVVVFRDKPSCGGRADVAVIIGFGGKIIREGAVGSLVGQENSSESGFFKSLNNAFFAGISY